MIPSTIISAEKRGDDTLFTLVRYEFEEKELAPLEIEVAHFCPKSKQEVLDNIENRGQSERAKLLASSVIDNIINELKL